MKFDWMSGSNIVVVVGSSGISFCWWRVFAVKKTERKCRAWICQQMSTWRVLIPLQSSLKPLPPSPNSSENLKQYNSSLSLSLSNVCLFVLCEALLKSECSSMLLNSPLSVITVYLILWEFDVLGFISEFHISLGTIRLVFWFESCGGSGIVF